MKLAFVDFEGSGESMKQVCAVPARHTRPYRVRTDRLRHITEAPHHFPGSLWSGNLTEKGRTNLKAKFRLV